MEKKMIKRIRKKDPKGIDYIMNTYSKRVYFLVDKIIGNYGKEEVEECVSDVFLSIWNDIDEYDDKRGDFSKFIFMKAKFKALDYRRILQKKEISSVGLDDGISNNISTESVFLDKESSNEIINVINKFKEPDKTYFYLKYFMYYKVDEIAEKFETTRASVENRLYRCRLQLKTFLEGENQYEG